jgi:Ribonuclease G/E
MKEQVSVDDKFVDDVETELACGHVAWDTIPATYICEAVIEVYKCSTEYQRLKRLDEKIKTLAKDVNENPLAYALQPGLIKFLKDLCNENTQES